MTCSLHVLCSSVVTVLISVFTCRDVIMILYIYKVKVITSEVYHSSTFLLLTTLQWITHGTYNGLTTDRFSGLNWWYTRYVHYFNVNIGYLNTFTFFTHRVDLSLSCFFISWTCCDIRLTLIVYIFVLWGESTSFCQLIFGCAMKGGCPCGLKMLMCVFSL